MALLLVPARLPNTYFDYPAGNAAYVKQHPVDVLLLYPAGDSNGADAATFMGQHPTGYVQQTYKLRSWWDEGYKPLPPANPQPSQFLLYGDGFGNWLVYGKAVPASTKINWLTGAPTAARAPLELALAPAGSGRCQRLLRLRDDCS